MTLMEQTWSLEANTSTSLMIYQGYHARISCKQHGTNKTVPAKRRFVYCWKKDVKATSWENVGLLMTDDDGKLFDLETFFTDKGLLNAHLEVNKYDPEAKKFASRPWQFFGGTEDTICFQKYCGDHNLGKKSNRDKTADSAWGNSVTFRIVDPDAGVIYSHPFFVQDEYLLPITAGYDYFLMFCPPDIALKAIGGSPSSGSAPLKLTPTTATTAPEFKFINAPLEHWLENSYITSDKETLEDIAKKTGTTADAIKKYGTNSGKLPATGRSFEAGTVLSIPSVFDSNFGFGRTIKLSGFVNTVAPDKLAYNRINKVPLGAPVIEIPLPLTLEEYLSNIASETCILDITWAKIIASSQVFIEASQSLRHIADLTDLMLRFPGYKERTSWKSSAMYSGKMVLDSREKVLVDDFFIQSDTLSKDVANAAFTMQNPVFRQESSTLFTIADTISTLFVEQDFIEALAQWRLFAQFAKDQNRFPFLWDLQQMPALYSILENAIALILAINAKKKSSDEKTIAESFYIKILMVFQTVLEIQFNTLDYKYKLSDELATKLKGYGALDKKYLQINPDKIPTDVPVLKPDSVLTVIFKDVLIDKVLANSGKHLTNILKVSSQFRASNIIFNCEQKKKAWALYHFKISVAALFITDHSPENLKKKLNEAHASFEKNYNRLAVQKIRVEGILAKDTTSIKDTTEDTKYLEASIASFNYFWSIYEFYETLTPGQMPTKEQWLKIVTLVQSGWAIAAGLGMKEFLSEMHAVKCMETMLLKTMGKDCRYYLRGGMALYKSAYDLVEKVAAGIDTIMFPVEIYQKSLKAYDDWLAGDRTAATLRSIQAGIAVATKVGMCFGFAWALPASAIAELSLEAVIQIREANKLGIENTIASLNRSVVNGNLFRNRHVELYSDVTYVLATDTTILSVIPSATRYLPDKVLTDKIRALSTLSGQIKYINLDVVKAGSVMKARGYSDDEIAYITMEIKGGTMHNSLSDYELKYINGFAKVGTFAAENSITSLANGSYRDPQNDYYFKDNKTTDDNVTFADPPSPREYFSKNYGIII